MWCGHTFCPCDHRAIYVVSTGSEDSSEGTQDASIQHKTEGGCDAETGQTLNSTQATQRLVLKQMHCRLFLC